MKTREQIVQEILNLNKKHLLLSMATGVGKSKAALDVIYANATNKKVLIVYPKIPLKQNWVDEITKWGYADRLKDISFTTYNSLHKYAGIPWDAVIFDEGHHITERVLGIIEQMHIEHAIVLSATVKVSLRYKLEIAFPGIYTYRVGIKEAIDSEILPDPTIIVIPLHFSTVGDTETIIKNPKATKEQVITFADRFNCKNKSVKYVIPCTEAQYHCHLDSQVEYYKKLSMGGNTAFKNLWLHKAGERLKWLASKKTAFVKKLLQYLEDERTLTFCGSIEQTEQIGQHCIHSKNKVSQKILQRFNSGKINHITSIAILDEGCNLTNCRIGIFANINSSERIITQRFGRLLRHPRPILIIPYYKNSREQEIVFKMLEGYNEDLIKLVHNPEELKDLL